MTKALGNWGEQKAAEWLRLHGYEIVGMNYRSKWGEIDIVAKDRDCLVVVEVKTRSGSGYGEPAEAVTKAKLAKLSRTAWQLMMEWGVEVPVRFEVAEVSRSGTVRLITDIEIT